MLKSKFKLWQWRCQLSNPRKVTFFHPSSSLPLFFITLDALHDVKSKRDINMENVRIVQKNLVFVSGLPASIADADVNYKVNQAIKIRWIFWSIWKSKQSGHKPTAAIEETMQLSSICNIYKLSGCSHRNNSKHILISRH